MEVKNKGTSSTAREYILEWMSEYNQNWAIPEESPDVEESIIPDQKLKWKLKMPIKKERRRKKDFFFWSVLNTVPEGIPEGFLIQQKSRIKTLNPDVLGLFCHAVWPKLTQWYSEGLKEAANVEMPEVRTADCNKMKQNVWDSNDGHSFCCVGLFLSLEAKRLHCRHFYLLNEIKT